MSVGFKIPEFGDTVQTRLGGMPARAMVRSVDASGTLVFANVVNPQSGSTYERTLRLAAGEPREGEWSW